MALTISAQSPAGPSRRPFTRTANFESDDEEAGVVEDHHDSLSARDGKGEQRMNGVQKRIKRGHDREDDGVEGKRKRGLRAEELFQTRQDLPFYQARKGILEEIMNHDTTIIIGETGCGKSTQLPQLLRSHAISRHYYSPDNLDAPASKRGPTIAITQPRRLPTISLATRVAEEMGVMLGGPVGYTVRFEDVSSHSTRVRYMTEGVLMRELTNGDRSQSGEEGPSATDGTRPGAVGDESLNLLLKYDIVIIDEAHERTLNTDFLCGILKRVQQIRKQMVEAGKETEQPSVNGDTKGKRKTKETVTELKIVIMSATLDPTKFQRFFETGRDTLLVKGRMFDVATRHLSKSADDLVESAATQAMVIHESPKSSGDILIFMPGADDIEKCCELLRNASDGLSEGHDKLQVLPLFAALPPSAQARIFAPAPPNTRRVVVATNIAETSITIPGIAYVIDTGFKKEKNYIFQSRGTVEHLEKKPISQAAAWQRTGRAGRERSGECFRLYTKQALDKLEPFDKPEIQRCNLSAAVLQLIAMSFNPVNFDFVDNPGRDPLNGALQQLAGLNAIKSPTEITPLGRAMLHYPLDPSHARILLAAFDFGCPSEIIDILSLLNAGELWIDISSEREGISEARNKFLAREGDHLTSFNAFQAYLAVREQKATPQKWCRDNFVNPRTLVQAIKIRDQIRLLAERDGRDWRGSCGSDKSVVVRALLQGLYANTAAIQPDGSYRQIGGTLQVKIHPGSVLMSKKVPAILYDELAFTSGIYARGVSAFEQHWLADTPWATHMPQA
ncbi:ATP-dependent RNA helicase prh1 [Kockovaella imperatae]|uniref:RNA helicase n=1 Tax=Kockovaella imperatae TaxID=4999 RepID=A0A1Y1UT26_9TREE|nr:ATP-dependent RNA helicase prh1 [Kockovaella imperatae]ORX41168.1 ATP-dependent RNA helicase prh1 [Kockovaella imperatae]